LVLLIYAFINQSKAKQYQMQKTVQRNVRGRNVRRRNESGKKWVGEEMAREELTIYRFDREFRDLDNILTKEIGEAICTR
jgi:hypothetical protein